MQTAATPIAHCTIGISPHERGLQPEAHQQPVRLEHDGGGKEQQGKRVHEDRQIQQLAAQRHRDELLGVLGIDLVAVRHSPSISGTILRAVTKNSAMAWAGDAKKKIVSVTPAICQLS
jgi:hypothetical protein